MIAKLNKGRGFRGALEYSLKESKGFLLDTNMGGNTPRTLAREFGQVRTLRPEIARPVHHTSLALSPKESLTDEQWKEVGRKYLDGMGFANNQYVIARHTDADHTHIHVLVNRVTLDGKLVSDSKDYHRQEQIMRRLEKEYGLAPVAPSKEALRRAPTKGELEYALKTGKASTKVVLQKLVDNALQGDPTYSEFTTRLERAGVQSIPNQASTGRISGISFQYEGITMKGGDLGRGYTWAGLQKRGLHYEQVRYIGSDERRDDTAARGREPQEHGGMPHAGIRSACDIGSSGAGSGTAFIGDHHSDYNRHTADKRSNGSMPESGRCVHTLSAQDGRQSERRSEYGGRSEERGSSGDERSARVLQGGNTGIRQFTGAGAKNPPDSRGDEVGIPVDNGGSGESALGRIAALANAGLRKNDHVAGPDMAKAGNHERDSGRSEERSRQPSETVVSPRKRSRDDMER